MDYRENKKTLDRVSLLGMGCMRFPLLAGDDKLIDRQEVQKMVDYAYTSGVNYYDTAYGYHNGKSEETIGAALKSYPRESFFLADKMPLWLVKEKSDLENIFAQQLLRCGVDYFDYYLCHAVSMDRLAVIENCDIYGFLQKKKQEGRVRRVGFSFHDSPSVLRKLLQDYRWDFVQLQINYFDWELGHAKLLYNIAKEFGLQVIIMEPVRGGALANLGDKANAILKANSPEKSIASWAVRFAASLPEVLTVLSGMSSLEQMQDNISSMQPLQPLTSLEHTVLSEALDVFKRTKTVPCTRCRYCMDCPFGVDIPEIFTLYNEVAVPFGEEAFKEKLDTLKKANHPERCTACGRCKELCPQQIDISTLMKGFARSK